MKSFKIKKSVLCIFLSLLSLATYSIIIKQNNQNIEMLTSIVTRITIPVSTLNIENQSLNAEQIKISPQILQSDSIRIYHLFRGYEFTPELSLQDGILQILPIKPEKTKGVLLKDFGDLYITPNKYVQKILLNGKEIWKASTVPES